MRHHGRSGLGALSLLPILSLAAVLLLVFLPPSSSPGVRWLIAAACIVWTVFAVWSARHLRRGLAGLAVVAERIEPQIGSQIGPAGADGLACLSEALDRVALRNRSLAADLRDRELEVRRLTDHDALTGLAGRRLFHELLVKELAHSRRDKLTLGLILVDLDGFKKINDTLGQSSGDEVLRVVAERLVALVREADTVARLGGNTFALVLSAAQHDRDVTGALERIWTVFEAPVEVDGQALKVSASAGVSLFPESAQSPELLLAHAEAALLAVKNSGGNRWLVFERAMDRESAIRLRLEQDFDAALRDGQLQVHYQPQCALRDGAVVGMEALARWYHPELEVLPAGRFIPIFEEAGLMPRFGGWLLTEICRQNQDWQSAGHIRVPVSVNVSVRQFQAGDVAEQVAGALGASGLAPEYLQLEITESLALHDIAGIAEQLGRCRELGVRIHLDDFGTGYSSLSYLLRFPVDVLKIDRSFVAGLPEDRHSAAIVRATIALASGLQLDVVAEGVETAQQLQFLREAGCQKAQGYLLGSPLPVGEIEAVLREGSVMLPG